MERKQFAINYAMAQTVNGFRMVDGYLNLYSSVPKKEKRKFKIITIKKLWERK